MMKSLKDVTIEEWVETCKQRKEENDRLNYDDPCFNCVMRYVCNNPMQLKMISNLLHELPKQYLTDTKVDMPDVDESSIKFSNEATTSKIAEPNATIDNRNCCGSCNKADGMMYASDLPKIKYKLTGEYHMYDDECVCLDTPSNFVDKETPSNTVDKETPNDDLPKILSALGVELEETFMIKGYPKMLFWIDSKGRLNSSFANDLVKCINDNSNIIHIPK